MAMIFGLLGRGFGRLGAARAIGATGGGAPAPTFPDDATSSNEFLIFFI